MDPTLVLAPIPMTDYLEVTADDIIRVKGHRIGLEHIVERYQAGLSPEQIALDFPGVDLTTIYNIIAYYLHNQELVDSYLTRVNARAEAAYKAWAAQPPSAVALRMRALKAARNHTSS